VGKTVKPPVTEPRETGGEVTRSVAVKVVAGAAEADMGEAMWYKREFIGENRVRYPVTLGVVDVDVRLQPAAQPAAWPLDPAAAESGLADRHPSLACRPAA
jgi:hypothetical protein